MFDILNSRDRNIFKRPLNHDNQHETYEFIEQSKLYLKGLKMNQVRRSEGIQRIAKINVLNTINKTPIVGFLVNLTNIPLMYKRYVEGDENGTAWKMTHFRTFALSQDRLELFFAKIRSRNGHNNNPNCSQFKGAYRRLLTNIEIQPPSSTNCMMFDKGDLHHFAPQSNVFTVSSRRPKLDILSDEKFQANLQRFEEQEESLETISDLADLAGMIDSTHLLEGFADTSIAYASKLIEESIEDGVFHCDCCRKIFSENVKMNAQLTCLIPAK